MEQFLLQSVLLGARGGKIIECVGGRSVLAYIYYSLTGEIMTRRLISSGSAFEEMIGYSRAVVEGDWVFVSGTTGFDYSAMTISDDLLEQAEQCFKNIESALQQAGSGLQDIVRVTYVLPNVADFEPCWPVLREYLGKVRPAAMMISAGLSDPRMRIEIQVTARKKS
jgi:enamine deaminase RidA (YjgF/YER057c/UK114 family)